MCRSPLALTVMSISECLESWSSIWSKKPTPVAMSALPVPSTSSETEISVSFVLRLTFAERDAISKVLSGSCSGVLRFESVSLLSARTGDCQLRCRAWFGLGFRRTSGHLQIPLSCIHMPQPTSYRAGCLEGTHAKSEQHHVQRIDHARHDDRDGTQGRQGRDRRRRPRSEEHTSELQSPCNLVCRLLL